MANWANPTITSDYVTFVNEVKGRDIDAITLMANAVTNAPSSAIRLLRSPIMFQEWSGSIWYNLVLSPQGGGTGVSSIAALTPLLGLGSMAFQNANTVNITGGNLSNVNVVNLAIGGNASYQGTGFIFYSYQDNTPLIVQGGAAGSWAVSVSGPGNGIIIGQGSNKNDNAIMVRNQAATIYGFYVRGDMGVICPTGLCIPVGANKFVAP